MVKDQHTDPEPQKAIPCPFMKCSGKPPKLGLLCSLGDWWVYCKNCSASGPHGHNEREAVELWNDRYPLSSLATRSAPVSRIVLFFLTAAVVAACASAAEAIAGGLLR